MTPRLALALRVGLLLGGLTWGGLGSSALAQDPAPPPASSAPAPAAPVPEALGAPFSLSDAVARLAAAPQWRQADLAFESAARAVESARAAGGLSFGVGGNLGYSALSAAGNVPSNTNTSASVSATLGATVLPWAPANDNVRAAERALATARATLQGTRATLLQNVQSAYFSARLARQDLTLAQGQLRLREEQLVVARTRREQGAASQEDLLSAQQNVETARAGVVQAQNNLDYARRALLNVLGLPDGPLNLTTAPSEPQTPDAPEALIARALTARREVVEATQNLRGAEDALVSARRDRLVPSASLGVEFGYLGFGNTPSGATVSGSLNFKTGAASATASAPVTSGATSERGGLSVNLSASYTLLDPAADAAIRSAQTSLAGAQLALSLARQNVELAVRQNLNTLQNARALLGARRTAVEVAQTALATARSRLAAGLAVSGDVLSAELALAGAQRDLEAALTDAQNAYGALQSATGAVPLPTAPGGTP